MTIDPEIFKFGQRRKIGEHHFSADAIIAFARKYDPQIFHLDTEAAKDSLYGGLCASGWHTAAVGMRKNVDYWPVWHAQLAEAGKLVPEFGPSPGFRNMRWPKPVYARDTISYHRTVTSVRKRETNPVWGILESVMEADNQNGELVMRFDSAVLIKLGS